MTLHTGGYEFRSTLRSEYILYDGQKVEADDQNEELIEGNYEEFLIKR